MGKVTDELTALLKKQIDDYGVVVWYDPEGHYQDAVDLLPLGETAILKFTGSYLELRHRVDPFLEYIEEGQMKGYSWRPPRLLVYLPRSRHENPYALIEISSAGVYMEPGAQPWQRNTRLKVLAERVAPEQTANIAELIEEGLYSLTDLDRIADQPGSLATLKLIFDTTSLEEVTLKFLSDESLTEAIAKKKALPELRTLFEEELGLVFSEQDDIDAVRRGLAEKLLLTELLAGVEAAGGEVPELEGVKLPKKKDQREAVCAICETWRKRLDLKAAYVAAARSAEDRTHVSAFELPSSVLTELETFPFIETRMQEQAAEWLFEDSYSEALELAQRRKNSVWSIEEPTDQLRSSLLETAARLLAASEALSQDRKQILSRPKDYIKAYGEGLREDRDPWHRIDRYHRHLEQLWSSLELAMEEDQLLEKVMAKARHVYRQVLRSSSDAFADVLMKSSFEVSGILPQCEIFTRVVAPAVKEGRTAYLLVDSLRFEMADELLQGLDDDFEKEIAPAWAQLPSITMIGMAALMPGAEAGLELVERGSRSLAVQISGRLMKDRAARVAYLQETVDGQIVELKLNDLMKPRKKLTDQLQKSDLALITSQEIDRLGEESETEEEVRRYINDVLEKLRRGIRRLVSFGFENIIVTSDHGHLFGEAIDTGDKMDPPGGKTFLLHRRVWIGRGGKSGAGYVRARASQIGLGGDCELAFPRSLGCFKSPGGGVAYFHGGLSLQETVIPVVTLKVNRPAAVPDRTPSVVEVRTEREKVTNRFFSITLTYEGGGLFSSDEKRVRIEVRHRGSEVGKTVTAQYGFEEGTGEIRLEKGRPNAVTLLVTEDSGLSKLSVHILDARSGIELNALRDLDVDIAS